MKNEINRVQLEHVLKQIKELEEQNLKVNVLFDLESQRISISYSLPKDYWEITKFGFTKYDS